MITFLICAGLFSNSLPAGIGTIVASAERTVSMARVPLVAVAGVGLPLGAPIFQRPLDTSDVQAFAIDFTSDLAADQTIAEIERLSLSSGGALLGVLIDTSRPDRMPIISPDGKMVQIWMRVEPGYQDNTAFADAGVMVGVSALIRIAAVGDPTLERTAVLMVRQL